ncbi:MAG: cytochrome c3 family protein [Thermodesulfobacteriota bacterium]
MKRLLLMFGLVFVLSSFVLAGCGRPPESKNAPPKRSYPEKATPSAALKTGKPPAAAAEARQDTPPVAPETGSAPAAAAAVTPGKGGAVGDVLEMKNTKAFDPHKMGIVMFSHAKHFAAKPDGYGAACGDCHHDKTGKPLQLKIGDPVQGCMECHAKPDKPPKKPDGIAAKEWEAMQLEYYYGAIHANCIDCHKAGGAGPVKCADCHPKPAK